ncbi:hypothetical protein VC157_06915 [Citrobacter freundii]|nr:hypothetical protein [Citrobacter freundii]
MLSEKQLIDLIQALQASNFSASEIFWLCIGLIAVALFMSYLVSISTEKGKIAAINANYERVREQLSLNTTTIKDIEKKSHLNYGFLSRYGKKNMICMNSFMPNCST